MGADDVSCLRRLFPQAAVDQQTVNSLLRELGDSACLREAVERHHTLLNSLNSPMDLALPGPNRARGVLLYATTRLLRPEVVIETGCATGGHSAIILHALQQNERGHLYSIDLPPQQGRGEMAWSMPPGYTSGFFVPDTLRARWTLIIGDVRSELLPLLTKLGPIGLFYHDSEHSYAHMMWEYTTVWPFLVESGLLVSDDVGWNTAFWDLALGTRSRWVIHKSNSNVGVLRKASSQS